MLNSYWKNIYKCFPKLNNLLPLPSSNEDQTITAPTSPLITNYNSLYTLTSSDEDSSSSQENSSPDFSTAFATQRFFISSPGPSNSILHTHPPILLSGEPVQTYSENPYKDFRRSMQEMVEARGVTDVQGEWDFLHELLSCYLRLNPEYTHRLIFKAFSDLIVSLVDFESFREIQDYNHRCRCPAATNLVVLE